MMRRLLPSIIIAIATCGLVALLQRPFGPVDDQFTSLKYQLRGEIQPDTNIVLIYIDNEAIKSFGWPPRRSFHALMVKALTELHVRTIGIEIQFENPNTDYPEYDDLFTNVVVSAHNVVLATYFQSITPSAEKLAGQGSRFPHVNDVSQWGTEPHFPFPRLHDAAAGIGHVNLSGESDIPLFISSDSGIVPSFALELLRVHNGALRNQVSFIDHTVSIPSAVGELKVCSGIENTVRLCFAGRAGVFTAYPFLEVLKSYDAVASGGTPLIPIGRLKGKVVLIGAIAEGISDFRKTPVDSRYPSLALHATFLDNALGSGFLGTSSEWRVIMLCLLMGFVCASAILLLPSAAGRLTALVAVLLVLPVSFLLFVYARYDLPPVSLLVAGIVAAIAALLYQHHFVERQVKTLQTEKASIIARLHDREAKVAMLERELLDFETARSSDRTHELMEEIRKYKAEIRSLGARADDMEEYHAGSDESPAQLEEFDGIVYGDAGKMKPVVDFVRRIASSDASVLILGESGTGKELVARALHTRSNRSSRPFIAVNCGALSEGLLESELFGHEKGAFTGAVKDKPGRFELADGGTIFLDEIGEVSEAFQLRLLRVLQEGEFERVGGTKTSRVDVRVVAATNRDLKEAVRSGGFREDLYYRLNVLTVELPPLRERQEDIPLLAEHFLRREGDARFSKNAMDALRGYGWPGNVREMESAVKRGYLLAKTDNRAMVTLKDFPEELSAAFRGAVAVEQQVLDAIREKGFSRSSISETAAELGGLNRGTVAEYLRGECLKAFAENGFDLVNTIKHISLTPDPDVNDRVRKKLGEYLLNISEVVDTTQPWGKASAALRPKTKNLPQRYHEYLTKVAEAYFRGLWKTSDLEKSA